MAALNAARRFAIITDALAHAEEEGGVPLSKLARDHDITVDKLKEVLDPILYLEFRDASGDVVDGTRSYFVDESDHLTVSGQHWLGVARSKAPDPDHALCMMIAAMIAKAVLPETLGLDEALNKLAEVVAAPIVIESSRPEFTELCEQALANRHTLAFAYFSESNARRREWELEPGFVGSNWGRWYVIGHPVGSSEIRTFRIDRIIEARITDDTCIPDRSITLPDYWDLDEYRRSVRLRLPRRALDRIPTPVQFDISDDDGADTVTADVEVIGDQRLTDLLVLLGHEAEIIDSPEAEALRRAQAERILTNYT